MQRALKHRGDQERRRFFVGVAVDASYTTVTATIVAATGRGLEARFEIANHVVEEVPRESTSLSLSLAHPCDASQLATQLAEVEAAAIERLSALEGDVWSRVLLAGVTEPGIWRRTESSCHYLSVCDSARLAEISGLNVVDAFPARDIAYEGRGSPLDAIPLWLLLRHAEFNRFLIDTSSTPRAVILQASRDERELAGIEYYENLAIQEIEAWLRECLTAPSAGHTLQARGGDNATADQGPSSQTVQELLLLPDSGVLKLPIAATQIRILDEAMLGVVATALPAACAAVQGMLHIDQTPGNLPHLTGAASQRVLGRLTPGSTLSWNRLLRDLAFVRPLIAPLRAAI